MTQNLKVEIFHGTEVLPLLRERWEALFNTISSPSLEQDWRWNHLVGELLFSDQLSLICVYCGLTLIGVFPCQSVIIKRAGLSIRALSNLSDPRYLVLAEALIDPRFLNYPILQAIKAYISKSTKFDMIEFSDFTQRSSLAELNHSGWLYETSKYKNAYISCTDQKDLKYLSKKHVRNVERLRNRAESELGPLQLEIFIGGELLPPLLDELLTIENSGWKRESGTSILASDSKNFYYSAVEKLKTNGDAYLIFISSSKIRIAGALAFKAGDRLFLHKIAYLDSHRHLGPGNILLLGLIQKAITLPHINEINFVTCPDWCGRWHLQEVDRMRLRCFSTKPRGMLLTALTKFKKLYR